MTQLPTDLQKKVCELFTDANICTEVIDSLEKMWERKFNVGTAQLARAIVFLSDGDIARFRELRGTFMGAPRDLLLEANSQLENTDYWFSEPYSEMGSLKKELGQN